MAYAKEEAASTRPQVTLASLPAVLDAAWWRRHAQLVRDPDDYVVLSFRPGTARDVAPPDATPVSRDDSACRGQLALELSAGKQIRRFTLRLPGFTLVAGTPDEGAILEDLHACFGLREKLPYDYPKLPARPARPAPARVDRGSPKEARPPKTRARATGAGESVRRFDVEQGSADCACPERRAPNVRRDVPPTFSPP